MARVRSTARPRDNAPVTESEGAAAERGAIDKGRESAGLAERTESVRASDVSSHSRAKGDSNEGSHTHSYCFGPSTVTIGHIREMIDHGYFAKGSARGLGEETIPEPANNEAVGGSCQNIFGRWLFSVVSPLLMVSPRGVNFITNRER
jgi:hypothetical protein